MSLESNLEDLRNGGVIPPLISLFNGSTDSIRLKAVWAISNLVVLGTYYLLILFLCVFFIVIIQMRIKLHLYKMED